jgi:glycerol-3-phosphate dehydrogenase (NAD(P)+)
VRGVEMPVSEAVAAIVAGRLDLDGAVEALMRRPLKGEGE